MNRYSKLFILMSLFYLFIGASIGLINAFGIALTKDMTFMHVHYNLLGFMLMMVMGVAYHIIPRFVGSFIKFPKLIAPQFWISNIGLILLTSGFHLKKTMADIGTASQATGGTLAYIGIILFISNIVATILKSKN